ALPANQLTVDGSTDIFTEKGTAGSANINIQETTDNTTSASVTGLDPGDYTIEVIDDGTGCTTSEVTVTVDATPVTFTPAVTVSSNQTSCDLSSPNGQLTASIAVGASTDLNDYNFQWFDGQNTNPANEIVVGLSGTNNSTVSNLAAGIYTLLATEINSNCDASVESTIVLDNENPNFSLDLVNVNTRCDTPDGSISFTIDPDGDSDGDAATSPFDGAAGYNVELFDGATIGATEVPLQTLTANDGVQATFNNLLDGTYSIRATDNNTNCVVEELGIVVNYSGVTASFDPSLFFEQNISACFDNDGIIDVGTGITVNNDYNNGDAITIVWYAGTDTSDVNNQLSNLHNVNPSITNPIDMEDITIADGDGDNITIVNGRIGDNSTTPGSTSGLPAISYTGVAILPNGCIEVFSTSLTFGAAPDVTIASVDPTRCATAFDGQISITLDAQTGNNPAQYRYYVFEGSQSIQPDSDGSSPYDPALSTYAPIAASGAATGLFTDATDDATELIDFNDNAALGQLPAGTYTIGVDFFDGGAGDNCIVFVGTVTLNDPEEPDVTIDAGNTINNSICDVSGALDYNGQITVDAIHNSLGGTFDFTWYYDSDGDGDFTVGQTLIDADGADEAGAGSNVVGFETLNANSATISGIGAGWYRVIATHNDGGSIPPATACPDTLDIQLFDELVTLSVGNSAGADWTISHIENCTDNGAFTLMRILQDGAVDPASDTEAEIQTDFTLTWNNLTTSSTFAPNVSETEADDLAAGDYRIDIESDLTGCVTSYQFTIQDNTIDPVISLNTKSPDTYCDGVNNIGDGSVTVNITEDGGAAINLADYSVEWYRGTYAVAPGTGDPDFLHDDAGSGSGGNVGSAAVGGDIRTLTDLENGTYTVFINKDNGDVSGNGNEGCQAFATFTIGSDQPTLTVNLASGVTVVDNDNCTPADGSITIDEIIIDGVATPLNNASPYTINWTAIGGGVVGTSGAGAITDDQLTGVNAGTYSFFIQHNTTGCATGTIDVEVEDLQVNPVISGTSTEDTYCDNTGNVGDGSLSISIDDEGPATTADYTITWYRGTIAPANEIFPADGGSRGATAGANADLTGLTGLATGDYTVVITKDLGDTPGTGNEGCSATAVFNVGSMDNIPTIDVAAIQANTEPDSLCTGNSGTLIINDADVSTGDLGDFEIRIYTGALGVGELAGSPHTNIAATSISYTNLAANDYYITAENTTTGCLAATAIVNVKDSVRNPQVTLVSMTPDEDCGGGVDAGGLQVLVDGQYDHTNQNFITFLWEDVALGTDVNTAYGVPNDRAVLSGVPGDRDYRVTVTKNGPGDTPPSTGCSIFREYRISNVETYPSITDYAIGENNICDDDLDGNPVDVGTFELLEATFKGATENQASMAGNYQLEVYDDFGLTSPTTDGDGDPTNFIYTELSAGTYFAIVRKLDSDCASEPLEFEIIDNVQRPQISIALQAADSTCTAGGTPEGALRATATVGMTSGIDDTDPDYTFQWYYGPGTGTALLNGVDPGNGSTPAGVGTSDVSGLAAGTYTVEVTRTSTGCVTTAEFELPNVPTNVEIQTVSVVDATNCTPGNGTITVTTVNRDNVTDYDFDYYDVDPTVGSPAPVFTGNGGAAYTTAVAGTYWIIGTNTIVNCTTPIFEVEVDENLTYPNIVLDDFDFQTNCDPSNPNGRLLALADGQPENATYDFEWYYGTDDSNPLTSDDFVTSGVNLAGASSNEVFGLEAAFYTVVVTNTTTGCSSMETFEMVDNIPNPIAISTSTSANTNCASPNGKMAASVITLAPGRSISDYSFYWWEDDGAADTSNPGTADFTGSLVENRPGGNYLLVVVDDVDSFCESEVIQVTIEDATTPPTYTLETRDVTVCFDDKDGFASVSVPDLSSVDIAWYDDASNPIGTTFYIDSLDAGMYTLELTHVITGCTATEVFEILNNAITPSAPTVIVNNGRNNCSFANGSAIANVDGITNNFLFEWFDPTDMNTPYATGSEVFNLDTTTYLVRATNLATGCESPMTSVDIGYEVVDPEYEVVFNNSVCLRTEDGSTNQFTGTAVIQFDEFNLATDYEWRDSNGTLVGTDSRLIDAYPGDYFVTFTAENGCSYEASFTIETSLTIYNGVSANADGKNDFFLVDCIDYFPNNNVKIYNRAGQRLFEVDGYNNTDVRFEGFSNVGGGGLQLPAGTYFYIIDLGNGEDPVQGFLELVR
ncbi:gliding motility-associated C-terminal domain-containing protein, partial [Ekhidna sp. MALMAid0563]|uniref:gliding motility-associated C-terminal domain-containing protein n=1 Tax=Ekhidna sp. MALMAid0563 TaxID=3143937 RepID=UPI0032DF7AE3